MVAGGKLPTESQLAQETGLSLTTVRRAFDELVRQGLVCRRQGAGTFVETLQRRDPRSRRTIGVLVPPRQLHFARVLQGIEEGLSAAEAGMHLSSYNYDENDENRDLDFLLDSGVDALLLVPTLVGLADPRSRVEAPCRSTPTP